MAFKLNWDANGERLFETGVDRGVLFVKGAGGSYGNGVEWNGLTSVSESPEGGEPNALYADNIKYLNLISPEEFNATIEAYTYPDEFGVCDGSISPTTGMFITGQKRSQFAFCYRTKIGNDQDGSDHGYKLHIVYNCYATPSEKSYETINDSPDAITFSWEVSTTPVTFSITESGVVNEYHTAHIEIDSTAVDSDNLKTLEEIIYGKAAVGSTAAVEARLPMPDEIYNTLSA